MTTAHTGSASSIRNAMTGNPMARCALITISRILNAAFLVLLLVTTWNQARSWTGRPIAEDEPSKPQHKSCLAQHQQSVGIMVKRGASEAFDKLPVQLQTTLGCAGSFFLVADLDFEFKGRRFHDVLKDAIPLP